MLIVGLHEDGTEAIGAPIGFQEGWLQAVVSGQARARGDAEFHGIEKLVEGGSPSVAWNGLAVVQLDHLSEWFQFELEVGTVFVIKITQLDQRVQCLTGRGEWPVVDHVKFRFGGAVSFAGQIVTHVLDAAL